MVVPTSTEYSRALLQPLEVIDDLSKQHGDKIGSVVQKHFTSLFETEDARRKVPYLAPSLLEALLSGPSGTAPPAAASSSQIQLARLVRWRCMIQDTSMGNEVVPQQIRSADGTQHTGLFGAPGLLHMDEEGDAHVAGARAGSIAGALHSVSTLYGVSIPGQSQWAVVRDESGEAEELLGGEGGPSDASSVVKNNEFASDRFAREKSMLDKLPLGEGVGALLKVYDEDIAESVRVAEVVDVLGVIDQAPLPSANWSSLGTEGPLTELTEAPLFTTLHVIALEKRRTTQAEEHVTDASVGDSTSRDNVLALLKQVLDGDDICAQWTLLAIIARIHSRAASHTLGALSLNISHMPSPPSESSRSKLAQLMLALLPSVSEQSLNLAHLNDASTRLEPKSVADEGGLKAGRLQLVEGTLLFLDESSMQEGQLKDNGIANVRTLSTVMTTHKLPYAFPFSSLEMDVDLPCIVLSQGKSFLPANVQVPLQVRSGSDAPFSLYGTLEVDDSTRESLPRLRAYLESMRSTAANATLFTIPADISQRIQDDFVESRKPSSAGFPAPGPAASAVDAQEELSRTLEVARLVCLSHGQRTLRWQDWEEAKRLNNERKRRLA